MAQHDVERKKALLIKRVAAIFRVSLQEAEQLLLIKPVQSVRLNALKQTNTEVLTSHQALDWIKNARIIVGDKRAVVNSEAAMTGEIYIQNAASFLPVLILDPHPGEKILDMCAAPGGKASHIAALTGNQAELWVNDNSRPRLAKMRANFDRLGVKPARVTLFEIARLGKELNGEQFDKILLDAPCSGEGMLDINNSKDLTYWSVAQIKRLQGLQKRAIMTAWELLKPGGTLVYSTCTMAPEENEVVVDYLLRRRANAELQPIEFTLENRVPALGLWQEKTFQHNLSYCLRLKPSETIEAFFVAKFKKTETPDAEDYEDLWL